jgi:aspartate aminotransferase-like enzyme
MDNVQNGIDLSETSSKQSSINMLPGPTWVPDSIMSAMLNSNIYHRSEEFHILFNAIREKLRYVFRTTRDVYAISSSGTGGLEAIASNLLSSEQKTLTIVNGYFSQELSSIVGAFGKNPVRLDTPWDESISLDAVEKVLRDDPGIGAIGVAYVETSTGARAPLKELSAISERHGRLLFTDAESAVGGEEFRMDDWKLGAAVAGTQKCICSPPGLALVCLGDAGRKSMETNGRKGFYFDLRRYEESAKKGETPFTPALPQLFALRASLELIQKEGLENYIARQARCARMLRDGLMDLGLNTHVPLESASNVVTVVNIGRTGSTASQIVERMKRDHGIVIASGLGPIKEQVIRIGTMGTVDEGNVEATLDALKYVIRN